MEQQNSINDYSGNLSGLMATRLTGTFNAIKTKHAIIRFKRPVVKIDQNILMLYLKQL